MADQQLDELIYTSRRPLWHFLLALPLYIFTVLMSFKMFALFYSKDIMNGLKFTTAVFLMFVCAAGLTFTKRVYTNSVTKTVRFTFTLFRIPLCKDTIFKDVLYVSIYKNYTDRDYEVQIWFSEIEKKSVSVHLNIQTAFNLASKIANGLLVDLLDATEKGNFKWIEKAK
ncbi:hypothetical protein [Flavobacterium johnsoniae]|uniref:Uncharacterized protein n=1 Tax=Flavobacterium johnsoniae (strain ATCC 17061 / DSM 2064 / JCM 8514 / BCRC 14874 / CCUG 350202 / NBRC 14942 / NCIMB 11054 / UW101) TaxID=376686 RepID=A5FLR8_FLAJ1|nr:hypothetical protein [Flavobacterium johnsoniae]ABQ03850.1 hypothetical protein Fjoh_0816 [Flavobacterium johnsoniae UW101]OXE96280.1 hypothetical protein B0A63_22450 [Flavobacterium johnsoniae UW101]WQG79285.1 hypothetical protein SR927_14775 [Flavobacterium johnsoniae UW101]